MNGTDQSSIDLLAMPAGFPPFPTWPPPSGGAPVTAWELGPITNPYPYGSTDRKSVV